MVKLLSKNQKFSYSHLILLSSIIGMVITLYGVIFLNYPHKTLNKNLPKSIIVANFKDEFVKSTVSEIQFKELFYENKSQNIMTDVDFFRPTLSSNYIKQANFFLSDQQELEISRNCPVKFSTDLSQVMHINNRKELFVSNLLPSILAYNEEVQADRNYLIILKEIKDRGQHLSSSQTIWLNQLAVRYKTGRVNIAELLKRVDVIPPSLALGQAVMETGWGKSLAAQGFNSPFGMMRNQKNVFSYSSLQESVNHYIHNLNTHEAYKGMREKRATLRNLNENLCSLKLAEGLIRYSILGKTYIHRVKNIITFFKLQKYDVAKLAPYAQSY